MDEWLCQLLRELLAMLCSMSGVSEPVWASAAGCLVHLTTHGGHFVASRADAAPPEALSRLLRCCQQYGWSQELYCHFVRLAANVLYDNSHPAAAAAEGEAAGHSSGGHAPAVESSSGPGPGAALSEQQLVAFGGVQELVYHFCRAPSAEAQSSLLAAALHAEVSSSRAGHRPGAGALGTSCPSRSCRLPKEAPACLAWQHSRPTRPRPPTRHAQAPPDAAPGPLAALVAALCGSPSALAAVQSVLRAASSGTSCQPMDRLLGVLSDGEGLELPLLSTVLVQLEKAVLLGACDVQEAEVDLEPVMEATERLVGGGGGSGGGSSGGGGALDAPRAWTALRDLAASPEQLARQLAANWLQRLLLAAFDPRSGACPLPSLELAQAAEQRHAELQQQQEQEQQEGDPSHRRSQSLETQPDRGTECARHLGAALRQLLQGGPQAAGVLLDAVERFMVAAKVALLRGLGGGSSSSSKRGGPSGQARGGQEAGRRLALRLAGELWGSTAQWVSRCMAPGPQQPGPGGEGTGARLQLAVLSRLGDLLAQMLCSALPPDALAGSASAERLGLGPAAGLAGAAGAPTALRAARLFLLGHTQGWVGLLPAEALNGIAEVLARAQSLHTSFSASTCGFQGRPSRQPQPPGAAAAAAAAHHRASSRHHPGRGSAGSAGARLRGSGGPSAPATRPASALLQQDASVDSDLGAASTISAASSALREPSGLDLPAGAGAEGAGGLGRYLAAPWADEHTDGQLALLLLLLGYCSGDAAAVHDFAVDELLRLLLESRDVRQRYYSALYLLKHLMLTQPERYWQALRQLVVRAQGLGDARVLGNPYLQISAMMGSLQA
jgi:hypothetical protein